MVATMFAGAAIAAVLPVIPLQDLRRGLVSRKGARSAEPVGASGMGRPGRRTAYNTAAMNLGMVGIAPFFLVVAAPFASDRISATPTSCGAYAIVGNLALLCEEQIEDCSGLFDPVKYSQAGKALSHAVAQRSRRQDFGSESRCR